MERTKKNLKKRFAVLCLSALCAASSVWTNPAGNGNLNGLDFVSANEREFKNAYRKSYGVNIARVVDGDTVDVNFIGEVPPECSKYRQRVRLIGVDTPEYYKKERQPYAEEAKEYTGKYLSASMVLTLDPDTSYKDKYGRLLAYLYDGDGTMLNYDLIRKGYGRYYDKFKFGRAFMSSFKAAERQAKKKKLGLWGLEDKE